MAVVIAALQVRVTIAGQSWTRCYDGFTAGVPMRAKDGLLPITGKLSLAPAGAPESMDPRINKFRFRRGNQVLIDIQDGGSWVRHDFGMLYILKTPSLYQPDANLELELGCILSLRNVSAPSTNASGVTLGAYTDRTSIINALLAKADAGTLVDAIADYPINYPLPKIEGSFVEQAGKVAYSALKYLWQDNTGQIRALSGAINPTATPVKSIKIGQGESEYVGSGGNETPAEKYRTCGTGTDVKSNYETTRVYSEDFGPVSAINPAYSGFTIIRAIETETVIDGNGCTTDETIQESASTVYSINRPTDFGLVWRSHSETKQYFDSSNRLKKEEKITDTVIEAIAAAFVNTLDVSIRAVFGSQPATVRDLTEYTYDPEDRVKKIVQTSYKPACAIALDKVTWTTARAFDEIVASSYIQEWKKLVSGYQKRETRAEAQATEKSVNDGYGVITTTSTIALITTSTNTSTASGDQNQPPATQYRPGTHTQTEVPLKGEAKFQIVPTGDESERTRDPQVVEYAVSNQQLNAIAQMEGAVLIGRSQSHTIQVGYFPCRPLDTWQVTEVGGTVVSYQMDGLEFTHSQNVGYVGAEGILLSTIESGTSAVILPYSLTIVSDMSQKDQLETRTAPVDLSPVTTISSLTQQDQLSAVRAVIVDLTQQDALSAQWLASISTTANLTQQDALSGVPATPTSIISRTLTQQDALAASWALGGGSSFTFSSTIVGPQGTTGLTQHISSYADDANYQLPDIGFDFPFYGSTYRSNIYAGSNAYVTFGFGSSNYSGLSTTNPGRGILINAGDRSWYQLWSGSNSAGTYRIRWVGNIGSSNTNQGVVWEVTLFSDGAIMVSLFDHINYSGLAYITKGDGILYRDFGDVWYGPDAYTTNPMSYVFRPNEAGTYTCTRGSYS